MKSDSTKPLISKGKRNLRMDRLVIVASEDGGVTWEPVPSDSSLPKWLLDPDVLGRLVKGEVCQGPQSSTVYGALRVEREKRSQVNGA